MVYRVAEAVDSTAGRVADSAGLACIADAVPDCRPALLADHPGTVHDVSAAAGVQIVAEVCAVRPAETYVASAADRRLPVVDIAPSYMNQV